MFEEARTKTTRFYIPEQVIRTCPFENLERMARFIGCIPDWPRESTTRPGKISRRYKRAVVKNLISVCCKPKEIWERRV